MSRGRNIQTILQPLNKCATQTYLGTGLHTLGLLNWILMTISTPSDILPDVPTTWGWMRPIRNCASNSWI